MCSQPSTRHLGDKGGCWAPWSTMVRFRGFVMEHKSTAETDKDELSDGEIITVGAKRFRRADPPVPRRRDRRCWHQTLPSRPRPLPRYSLECDIYLRKELYAMSCCQVDSITVGACGAKTLPGAEALILPFRFFDRWRQNASSARKRHSIARPAYTQTVRSPLSAPPLPCAVVLLLQDLRAPRQ